MRYTVLILIQILSFALIAQTINMPTVPENGVSYNFDQLEDNSEPISYSDQGPWDFSSVKTTSKYEMKLLPISHSSSQSDYPKATHFISSQNGEFFYSYEGNEIHNHGRITENTESSYSNAVLWMKFPLNSTSQFTDEITSDFKFNGASGTVKDNCTSKVLGVSTLILPNGKKYDNAMLVETTKAMEGEVFILKATITEYGKYWWVEGISLPVAAMEKFYLDDDLQYERSAFLNEEKLLSVDNLNQTAIDLYPNPAKQELKINLTSKSEVSIFDLQGKIVYQEVLSAGNQTLNVEDKPSGKYILVINDFNTVKRQIFLKQ